MNRDDWQEYRGQKPPPRTDGDEFTAARMIINGARLVMPEGLPRPRFNGTESTEERRRILAAFLREHGVPVPDFIPARYGWLDAYSGQLANPNHEPGADGRTHS
jgi:hypothetical protein